MFALQDFNLNSGGDGAFIPYEPGQAPRMTNLGVANVNSRRIRFDPSAVVPVGPDNAPPTTSVLYWRKIA